MGNFLKLMALLGGHQMLKQSSDDTDQKAMQEAEEAQRKKSLMSKSHLDRTMPQEDKDLIRRIREKYR